MLKKQGSLKMLPVGCVITFSPVWNVVSSSPPSSPSFGSSLPFIWLSLPAAESKKAKTRLSLLIQDTKNRTRVTKVKCQQVQVWPRFDPALVCERWLGCILNKGKDKGKRMCSLLGWIQHRCGRAHSTMSFSPKGHWSVLSTTTGAEMNQRTE